MGGTPAEAETVMGMLLQDHISPISMRLVRQLGADESRIAAEFPEAGDLFSGLSPSSQDGNACMS